MAPALSTWLSFSICRAFVLLLAESSNERMPETVKDVKKVWTGGFRN